MQQWEYMTWAVWKPTYEDKVLAARWDQANVAPTRGFPLDGVLQELGAAGWELVGIHPQACNAGGVRDDGHLYIFKRPTSAAHTR